MIKIFNFIFCKVVYFDLLYYVFFFEIKVNVKKEIFVEYLYLKSFCEMFMI